MIYIRKKIYQNRYLNIYPNKYILICCLSSFSSARGHRDVEEEVGQNGGESRRYGALGDIPDSIHGGQELVTI